MPAAPPHAQRLSTSTSAAATAQAMRPSTMAFAARPSLSHGAAMPASATTRDSTYKTFRDSLFNAAATTAVPCVEDVCSLRYSVDFLEEDLLEDLRFKTDDTSEQGDSEAGRTTRKQVELKDGAPSWEASQRVVRDIHENMIGRRTLFDSPYGLKTMCYADYTASGRALQCIEDYIRGHVLPHYGNTHTLTSITGLQTTAFREEARQIIAQAVNAKTSGKVSEDTVLFTGQGTTSAINKMVMALGLHLPPRSSEPQDRPIVFVGPFEHHSNILPWRESCAEVIQVPENADGKLDVAFLVEKLQEYEDRPLKVGSFSAASNLTGILTDVDHISAILHMHGALAFWDYASAAPYVQIDMNPVVNGAMRPYVYKDAVFFSGHKFVGGPNTPGVLVCKKRLLGNPVPTAPGGGTVFFVTKDDHRYLSNKIEREEGGTPDIVGSIRLGLAFELKQRVDPINIMKMEEHHLDTVCASLSTNPNVVLLGRNNVQKIPIFSFLIRFGQRFLHFNFVCALLNDLFGIQSRGGCQCAGPYATRILGITDDLLYAFEDAMVDKQIVLRAGFTRISFPYFMPDSDVDYILKAIHFVADHGWKFLPEYRFNHKTSAWKHHTRFTKFPNRRWISDFSTSKPSAFPTELPMSDEDVIQHQRDNLHQAHKLAREAMEGHNLPTTNLFGEIKDHHYDLLRWFAYPSEAVALIKAKSAPVTTEVIAGPVQPRKYQLRDADLAYSDEYAMTKLTTKIIAWERTGNTKRVAEGDASSSSSGSQEGDHDAQSLPASPANSSAEGDGHVQVAPVSPLAQSGSSASSKSPGSSKDDASLHRREDQKRPLRSGQDSLAKDAAKNHFEHAHRATEEIMEKVNSSRVFPTPPHALMRWMGLAIANWNMIQEGDRLLVAVSGGKDSMGLLHALLHLQKRSPIRFKLACATIDPQTPAYDPAPLKEYIKSIGLPHFFISEDMINRAKHKMQGNSILAYTARMKRGALYTCCRKNRYNKLVLGHHLDDAAESFMMSAMHNGQLRTMRATYWNDKKDVQIVRPLIYVREFLLKQFAIDARLPIINENVPVGFEAPKERERVKRMLSTEENLFPGMFGSLRRALQPLMSLDADSAKPSATSAMPFSLAALTASQSRDSILEVPSKKERDSEQLEELTTSLESRHARKRDKMRMAVKHLFHKEKN